MQGKLPFDASIMGAYVCAHRHRRHLPAKSGYDSEKRQVHFAGFADPGKREDAFRALAGRVGNKEKTGAPHACGFQGVLSSF